MKVVIQSKKTDHGRLDPSARNRGLFVGTTKDSTERQNFSNRLQEALRNIHHSSDSPTELSRDFNARFAGSPVTVHAARKWLVGEAIPTQDKLRTLSEWLGVPIEWLRFGGEDKYLPASEGEHKLNSRDLKLIADLQLLDDHHRQIVRECIRIIVRLSRQKNKTHIS